MGIKNFLSVKYAGNDGKAHTLVELGREIKWKDMFGKRVAIDAMNIIYGALGVDSKNFTLTDAKGRETKHTNTIMQKVLKFRKFGISQIWVFDGPVTTVLKAEEIEHRKATRSVVVTPEQIEEIKELLRLAGVCYMIAPAGVEGEMYAAFLTRSSDDQPAFCDYVISGDVDTIIVGGNVIMERVAGKKRPVSVIGWNFERRSIMNAAGLTDASQLIDVAACLGTDFSPKIKGIGPATVLDKVKNGSVTWTDRANEAREYIGRASNLAWMREQEPEFVQNQVNLDGLKAFLADHSFTVSRFNLDLLQ